MKRDTPGKTGGVSFSKSLRVLLRAFRDFVVFSTADFSTAVFFYDDTFARMLSQYRYRAMTANMAMARYSAPVLSAQSQPKST